MQFRNKYPKLWAYVSFHYDVITLESYGKKHPEETLHLCMCLKWTGGYTHVLIRETQVSYMMYDKTLTFNPGEWYKRYQQDTGETMILWNCEMLRGYEKEWGSSLRTKMEVDPGYLKWKKEICTFAE